MTAASMMQSPWWLTAGWMMVHFLWLGSIVGLVTAAGRWLLPSRPEYRYVLAVVGFAAVSCIPGLILVCMHPESRSSEHWGVPASPDASHALMPPVPVLQVVEASPVNHSAWTLDAVVRCLPWLWMFGTPLTFLLVATGLIGSERLRHQSEPLDQGDLVNRCRRLSEAMGVHCHVALGICGRLSAPILVGIFKPMILLPSAALTGLSIEQLEMVLLHELAHVRRWDNLVNLLQRIVEALLFFHPVVWWLSAWIRLEREMCCDRVVVACTGKPRTYAETLASLAVPQSITPTGALAMAENQLVIRIRRILNLEDRSMQVSSKWFGFTTALLVGALFVVGLSAYGGNARPPVNEAAEQETTQAVDKPLAGGNPATAQVRTVDSKDHAKKSQTFSLRAVIEPEQQVHLHSRVAGIVKTVMIDVGDHVKRGQVLVKLDVPDLQLELVQKSAIVRQANAETNQAKSSIRAAQAVFVAAKALVLEAEAGVHGARANYELRKKQVERVKKLSDAKAVESSALDEARERLDAAQAVQAASEAKWQAAKATVEESTARIGRAEADVQVAQANVAVAEAGLHRTQALLDAATILSPFDGVITSRNADIGSFSQAAGQGNARPLVTVTRTDSLRIILNAPEKHISKIRKGTPALIHVDAFPDKLFDGKVSRLSPTVDPRTATLRVEIDLPNPEVRLLPGMTCTVDIKLEK